MKEVERLQREIRNSGYLSVSQIILRLANLSPGINKGKINLVLKSIECEDIHKIEYTNSYVSAYKLKGLYYYNPATKKKKPQKRTKRSVKKT